MSVLYKLQADQNLEKFIDDLIDAAKKSKHANLSLDHNQHWNADWLKNLQKYKEKN